MFGKNFSLLCYLEKPKNYLRGDLPIYMRNTANGQTKELTLRENLILYYEIRNRKGPMQRAGI